MKSRLSISFLLPLSFLIGLAFLMPVAYAVTPPPLIVPIPITGGGSLDQIPANPATYIKIIYQWAIGLAALLAMAQLVLGGVQYVISAGMPSAKNSAEERMTGAITGLIILLCIVIILTAINPSLANISLPAAGNTTLQGVVLTPEQSIEQYHNIEVEKLKKSLADDGVSTYETQVVKIYNDMYAAQKHDPVRAADMTAIVAEFQSLYDGYYNARTTPPGGTDFSVDANATGNLAALREAIIYVIRSQKNLFTSDDIAVFRSKVDAHGLPALIAEFYKLNPFLGY